MASVIKICDFPVFYLYMTLSFVLQAKENRLEIPGRNCFLIKGHTIKVIKDIAIFYGAPFVNLLFNLFLEDFLVIYYLIYDN